MNKVQNRLKYFNVIASVSWIWMWLPPWVGFCELRSRKRAFAIGSVSWNPNLIGSVSWIIPDFNAESDCENTLNPDFWLAPGVKYDCFCGYIFSYLRIWLPPGVKIWMWLAPWVKIWVLAWGIWHSDVDLLAMIYYNLCEKPGSLTGRQSNYQVFPRSYFYNNSY